MKKVLIFISFLFLGSLVCQAQTDSTKTVSDSILHKGFKTKTADSIPAKTDTLKYALLYVYRPKNMVGFLIGYNLKVSNELFKDMTVGRVKNNSKFVVKLKQEGITEILARTEAKSSVKLNVKFGEKYYLKCGLTVGMFVGRPDLNLITPEQGELDYANVAN